MDAAEKKPTRSLARKLAEVMGDVHHVPKSGRNNFHNYEYATESDIVSAVRQGMAQRHLMLVPSVEKAEVKDVPRAKGGTERLATLHVKFTVLDGDSGEEYSFVVLGEGTDAGDKATYKALTGAVKYALLKLFLIPTGDDPEEDEPRRPQRSSPPPPDSGSRAAPRPQLSKESQAKAASVAAVVGGAVVGLAPALPVPLGFGSRKGTPLPDLSDGELSEAMDMAVEKLAAEPNARWASAMKENLHAMELELERRMRKLREGA